MIATASKPIRKRRQIRARRCTFKNAYTRFFTRVQVGPNLYAGYYAQGLGMDPTGRECRGPNKKECGPNKKRYDPKIQCCHNGMVFSRIKQTEEQCKANFDKNLANAMRMLKDMGVKQSIGSAALGTLATTVGGYFIGGIASGGFTGTSGGPIGAIIGSAVGAGVAIYDFSVDFDAANKAAADIKETYERCLECMK